MFQCRNFLDKIGCACVDAHAHARACVCVCAYVMMDSGQTRNTIYEIIIRRNVRHTESRVVRRDV